MDPLRMPNTPHPPQEREFRSPQRARIPANRGRPPPEEKADADRWVRDWLGRPTLAIGVFYLLLATVQAGFAATGTASMMASGSALMGTACLVLGTATVRNAFRPERVHAWGFLVAGLAALNGAMHVALTGDPAHTVEIALAVVAAGIVFLDGGWFALLVATAFVAWLLAIPGGALSGAWTHYALSLVGGGLLGTLALTSRQALFRHIGAVRTEERSREIEVRSALDRAEAAREGEERARLDVEAAVRQLKESEERFRRLAEASFEGVVIHQNGRMVDANRHASGMFGYSPSEFLQRRVELLAAPESREALDALLTGVRGRAPGDRPRGTEVVGLRANGTRFPMEVAVASVLHSGEPASVLVVRDVTARKQIEEMLRQIAEEAEESSRAKSAFLANMSHELRTPLNAVIGFANVLRRNRDGGIGDREGVFLDRIASNGRHLLTLINDVLDLSKIEAGRMELEMEELELRPFVEDVVQSLELARSTRNGPELVIESPEKVDPIPADRQRLRQVLINLVGNALKFTEAGRVTVRIMAEAERVYAIEVEDTGIGIPADRLPHIFSPFRQVDSSTSRRYGGTGLGLTISRSLCEMMGFALVGESELGAGSVFRIEIGTDPEASAQDHADTDRLRAG